jgi:hypothetical protein
VYIVQVPQILVDSNSPYVTVNRCKGILQASIVKILQYRNGIFRYLENTDVVMQ